MKKFLRFLGILVLLIVVVVVILGLIAPKDISTERSVTINAPKDVVAEEMFNYKNFNNWNPWAEMDSNMKSEVTGNEGAPGEKYYWKGNDKVGEGEMITKEVKADEKHYTMKFLEPMESNAEGYYKLEDGGNNTTIAKWGFTTHPGFPINGLMMVFRMKDMLAEDFDKGLNKLKAHIESGKAGSGMAIKETTFPATTYATIRKTIAWSEMDSFYSQSYATLGQAAGQRIAGPASSLIYMWDEKNMQADMAAAFPVSGTEVVNGATMVAVPQSNAFMMVYKGGYTGSGKAHEKIATHVTEKGKTMGLVIEEYVKGPGDVTDSNQYITNIYYLVQ